jgi:hypothetical protein
MVVGTNDDGDDLITNVDAAEWRVGRMEFEEFAVTVDPMELGRVDDEELLKYWEKDDYDHASLAFNDQFGRELVPVPSELDLGGPEVQAHGMYQFLGRRRCGCL